MVRIVNHSLISFLSILILFSFSQLYQDNIGNSMKMPLSSGIVIHGDENFTSENGVTRGSGTLEDPFVIENLSVYDDGVAIDISSTTKYFIIKNCTISGNGNGIGIYLSYVENATIINAIVNKFSSGIRLYDASHIEVTNCSITNCSYISLGISWTENVIVRSLKSIHSMDIIFSENIDVIECNMSGSLNLGNVNYINISETEAREGFFVTSTDHIVPHIGMIGNVTVQGKSVWYTNSCPIGTYPTTDIGEILLINVTQDSINEITNLSIPLLYFLLCENFSLVNSEVVDSRMILDRCSNTSINNCTFLNSIVTISWCGNLTIYRSHFTESFILSDNSDSIHFKNGTFFRSQCNLISRYLYYYNCRECSIINITAGSLKGALRIEMEYSNNFLMANCSIDLADICLTRTLKTSFINNYFSRTTLYLYYSHENRIKNNQFYDSYRSALELESTYNCDIFNNSFTESPVGLSIMKWGPWGPSNNIVHCTFINNGIGILLRSNNCSIYDNYFDNDVNVDFTDLTSAIWFKSIIGKMNIVGGPNSGGNFWNNYTGIDTDYDGFGNTDIPFGPGDEMPLIDLRMELSINDMTEGIPVTGDFYKIQFESVPIYPWVSTNYRINVSYYDHKNEFLSNDVINGSVPGEGFIAGLVSESIKIPYEPSKMTYSINVKDGYGKEAFYVNTIPIKDVTVPSIEFLDRSPFMTGENAWFRINVTDNVLIEKINVTISSDHIDNISYPSKLTREGNIWTVLFNIDPNCDRIMFTINATDINGNYYEKILIWIPVTDTIDPVLEFISPISSERCEEYLLRFRATDNIGLDRIQVKMLIDGIETRIDYESNGDSEYYSPVWIFDFQGVTSFIVRIEDVNGNKVEKELTVKLNPLSEPIYELNSGDPTTGDQVEIILNLYKEYLYVMDFICSFDTNENKALSYPSPIEIDVPSNARFMNISFSLRDLGGYVAYFENSYIVKDNDHPIINIISENPKCGELVWIHPSYTDNIGVLDHWVIYNFGKGPVKIMDNENEALELPVPIDAHYMNISIWARDLENNIAQKNRSLKVLDTIPPSIIDIRSDFSSGLIQIYVTVDDNLGISEMNCNMISSSLSEQLNMKLTGEIFELTIDPPEGISNFSFRIVVTDASGNTKESEDQWIEISDNMIRPDSDRWDMKVIWILGFVSLIILCIILFSLFKKYIKKKSFLPEE